MTGGRGPRPTGCWRSPNAGHISSAIRARSAGKKYMSVAKYAVSEMRSRIQNGVFVGQRLALQRRLTPPGRRRTEGPPQRTALPHVVEIR